MISEKQTESDIVQREKKPTSPYQLELLIALDQSELELKKRQFQTGQTFALENKFRNNSNVNYTDRFLQTVTKNKPKVAAPPQPKLDFRLLQAPPTQEQLPSQPSALEAKKFLKPFRLTGQVSTYLFVTYAKTILSMEGLFWTMLLVDLYASPTIYSNVMPFFELATNIIPYYFLSETSESIARVMYSPYSISSTPRLPTLIMPPPSSLKPQPQIDLRRLSADDQIRFVNGLKESNYSLPGSGIISAFSAFCVLIKVSLIMELLKYLPGGKKTDIKRGQEIPGVTPYMADAQGSRWSTLLYYFRMFSKHEEKILDKSSSSDLDKVFDIGEKLIDLPQSQDKSPLAGKSEKDIQKAMPYAELRVRRAAEGVVADSWENENKQDLVFASRKQRLLVKQK